MAKKSTPAKQTENFQPESYWHLDKRVPITLVVAIIVQTLSIVWFIAALNTRVDTIESWQRDKNTISERIVSAEVQLVNLKDTLSEIKDLLRDNLTDNRARMLRLESYIRKLVNEDGIEPVR